MKKRIFGLAVKLGVGLLLASEKVMAADSPDGDVLGTRLCKVVDIFTGKYLFAFAVLAVVGAGLALLFGGEISDGLKKVATIIAIVGMILMAPFILSALFPSAMSCA